MSKIAYLTNARHHSGVGHQAQALAQALAKYAAHHTLTQFLIDGQNLTIQEGDSTLFRARRWPGLLGQKTVGWLRLGYRLKRELGRREDIDIVHATNQTLSFAVPSSHPSVVTVHDIIELVQPQSSSGKLAARILYQGITRASHIIAVSQYTANELQQQLGIPASRITIVHNGVSQEFYPLPHFQESIAYHTLQQELKLTSGKIILYVGSEHPRKNVTVALAAFAKILEKYPSAVFLKVGEPGFAGGRAALLDDIERMGLRRAVRLVGTVSINRLNELYNLADVLIFPSLQEGFGLPPLQAMAAGLPVVVSSATSLPEVVGNAALQRDPQDVAGFAADLLSILEDEAVAHRLQAAGRERAKQFSWARAATAVSQIYDQLKLGAQTHS